MRISILKWSAAGWLALAAGLLNIPSPARGAGAVAVWGDSAYGQLNQPPGLTNVQAVAAGGYPGTSGHCVALDADGTVVMWGASSSVPAGLSNVVSIATGSYHVLALKNDGTVAAWAYMGSLGQADVPAGLSNVVAVAGGGLHSLALKNDGTVTAWGYNVSVPAGLSNVVAIAAGDQSSVALKSDGTVLAWGAVSSPVGLSNVMAVAMGGYHGVALLTNGTVADWDGSGTVTSPAGVTNAVAVAAGFDDGFALLSDGTLASWGPDGNRFLPLGLTNVSALGAGGGNGLAVYGGRPCLAAWPTNQSVYSGMPVTLSGLGTGPGPITYQWQLNGTNLPGATTTQLSFSSTKVSDSGTYTFRVTSPFGSLTSTGATLQVSASAPIILQQPTVRVPNPQSGPTFSVTATGSWPLSYQWRQNGTNLNGATASTLTLPVVQAANAGSYEVVVSNPFGSVLSSNVCLPVLPFSVVAWGDNNYGECSVPPGLFNPVAVAGGYLFSLALKNDGTVAAWGENALGECNVPGGLTNATAIAAGAIHGIALKPDGTVVTWGSWYYSGQYEPVYTPGFSHIVAVAANRYGSLGLQDDGTVVSSDGSPFVYGTGISGAVAIAGGSYHSLAIRTNGSVVAWGDNTYGQLNLPADLTQAQAVAAGYYHSLALKPDGTVTAWGRNNYGQTNVPPGLSNVVAVACGDNHSLALRADGTVVGWGALGVPGGLTNVVSIAGGGTHSLAVVATGPMPPVLTQPGSSQQVFAGASATFQISALGVGPLSYQWQLNGVAIPGATGSTLTVTNAQLGDGGSYSVQVSNAFGTTPSPNMTLTVIPWVGVQPASLTVLGGSNLTFTALSGGFQPPSYQWLWAGTPLPGATAATLTLTNLLLEQAGAYAVIVSNTWGAMTSTNVLLTVTPWAAIQPASQTVFAGNTANFTATSGGLSAVAYQWRFNGADLPGQTQAQLVLSNVSPSQAGTYTVVASNALATNQASATLSVPSLQIATQPKSQVVWKQTPAALNVTMNGQPPFSYQWQFNGTNLPGATSSALVFTNAQFAQSGLYDVVVANTYGSLTSAVASLRVSQIACWAAGTSASYLTNLPGTLTLSNILQVAAGSSYGLELLNTGKPAGWGYSFGGPAGGGSPIPASLTNAVAIAGGANHSLALVADGTVLGWAYSGQYVQPTGLTGVVAIASGYSHDLALKSDGTVFAWGLNTYGQTSVPVGLSNVVAVAAGYNHSLALKADGTVTAWGNRNAGQTNVPVGLANVVAIAAGGDHCLALTSDGQVAAWGNLNTVPAGLSNVVAIASGYYHDLALRADGTLAEWWLPSYSAPLPALSNVVAIACGDIHSLALLGDGPPPLHAWLGTPVLGPHGLQLPFPTQSGRVYALEYSDSPLGNHWTPLPLVAGTGTALNLSDPSPSAPQRFYRVRRW